MRLFAGFVLAIVLAVAAGSACAAERVEIPVRQISAHNGRIFYYVMVTVGGSKPFAAMLDSGSTGLRVLPGLLAPEDAEETGHHREQSFGSGERVKGFLAHAQRMTIGGAAVTTPMELQIVHDVDCLGSKPHCAAQDRDVDKFRWGAFKAMLGIRLDDDHRDINTLANPLAAIGEGRWILSLPRPWDIGPGKLIFNPSDEESAGYTQFDVKNDFSAIGGCLITMPDQHKVCGGIVPDTGAFLIAVLAHDKPMGFPWAPGTKIWLVVQNTAGDRTGAAFTASGEEGSAFHLKYFSDEGRLPTIVGVGPFFVFNVLYDAKKMTLGLKAREDNAAAADSSAAAH
jgi:hypothetical protein